MMGFGFFSQFASLCLLIGAFSPFTFKVNIAMCEFDTAILMLAGCFGYQLLYCFIVILGVFALGYNMLL